MRNLVNRLGPSLLAISLLLSACTATGPCDEGRREPSLANPPVYPNARVVSEGPSPEAEGFSRTQLETDASTGAVLEFYKDALVKDGWELRSSATPKSGIEVRYNNCCRFGGLSVDVASSNNGKTIATINRNTIWQQCE